MFKERRGSITVFICIVLAVVIPLSCILVDLSRYFMGVKQAKSAVKTSVESMLAAYDRQLRDQYGLFAMYPRDAEAMEQEIYELLSQNLNNSAEAEGSTNLYGFKVKSVEVVPFYNLSEPEVMTQQVAEFMKYRAPVQVVQEFIEKIKLMTGLMKESDMVGKKMSLDKLANDVRSNLVNIYGMLERKLKNINFNPKTKRVIKTEIISTVKTNTADASSKITGVNNEVNNINTLQKEYIAKNGECQDERDIKEEAEKFYNERERELNDKKKELEDLNKKLNNEKGKARSEIQSKIDNADLEVKRLTDEFNAAQKSLMEAQNNLAQTETELNEIKRNLDEKLSYVLSNLDIARSETDTSSRELNRLLVHIEHHIEMTKGTIAILDEIGPQITELEKQSTELMNSASSDDSAVSDRIKGDIEKQQACIKKETFDGIKSQLTTNISKLEFWQGALKTCINTLNQSNTNITQSINAATTLKSNPGDAKNSFQACNGHDSAVSGVAAMVSALNDLNALTNMKETYIIPAYDLVPRPNETEMKAFENWFFQKYGSGEGEEPPPVQDETDLQNVRDNVKSFAGDVGTQGTQAEGTENTPGDQEGNGDSAANTDGTSSGGLFDNSVAWVMDQLKNNRELPSKNGSISSVEALAQIGRAIKESEGNNTVTESPFDKPAEGLDTVNENDKNFFDYEIERIRKLIDTLSQLLSNLGEGLIESLYMNEYIVSAFKNEATPGNIIEHDIGWGRPLDNTAFKKAEVEYVIFGRGYEEANVASSKRTVFAIRLVFNLLHVYTSPDKLAKTLAIATEIAGWTIFGVPIVQNFLLISWAGLESYLDTEILIKGGRVPLIKTASSWYLEPSKLKDFLTNNLLKKVKDFAKTQLETKINEASEAVEETITNFVDAKIDELFTPLENFTDSASALEISLENEITSFVSSSVDKLNFGSGLDGFTTSFTEMINSCVQQFGEKLRTTASGQVAAFKQKLKDKVREIVFGSELYKKMVQGLKDLGNKLIDKAGTAIEGKIDSAFGTTNKSSNNNIAGRLIMMDYTDYLRLMLLAVPADIKALRTADLMQLNMQKVSGNNDIRISNYKTYLFVKVELDMNMWFLPEQLFKKNNAGMISVEWSQGY